MADKAKHIISNEKEKYRRRDILNDYEEVVFKKEKKRTLKFDLILFVCMMLLSAFGVLIIYSATRYSLPAGVTDPMFYAKKQLVFLGVSTAVFISCLFFDYRKLKTIWFFIYLLGLAGLILVLFIGYEVNSNKAWIDLGFTSIQPSEFSKIFMVISLAGVLSKWKKEKQSKVTFKKIIFAILISLSIILLVLLEPDFGQAIIYFITFIGVLFISGANIFYILAISIISSAGVFGAIKLGIIKQYQLDRLLVFLKPDVRPEGVGYNLFQSKLAIGSGKLFGKGLFQGTQTNLNYVPEHHTDFIFSVIGEEFGFAGALIVIVVLGVVVFRCFYVSRAATDEFGSIIAGGIGFIILAQMTINIGMTIGLMPIIGITLPFLSAGGSNLIAFFIGLGLVENIYLRRETRKEYEIAYEDYK